MFYIKVTAKLCRTIVFYYFCRLINGIALMTRIFCAGILSITQLMAFTQKTSTSVQQTWVGYFNQTRFSEKWGMWAEGQIRTKEKFVTDLSQAVLRVGATYYIKDRTKLTAGYAFFNFFPQEGHTNVSQPEHRPWQQIQWHTNYPKLRIMQWVRLEERFRRKIKNNDELAEGYSFNYRARYNLYLAFPLSKNAFAPKTFSLGMNDEVHINFGKQITYNT